MDQRPDMTLEELNNLGRYLAEALELVRATYQERLEEATEDEEGIEGSLAYV